MIKVPDRGRPAEGTSSGSNSAEQCLAQFECKDLLSSTCSIPSPSHALGPASVLCLEEATRALEVLDTLFQILMAASLDFTGRVHVAYTCREMIITWMQQVADLSTNDHTAAMLIEGNFLWADMLLKYGTVDQFKESIKASIKAIETYAQYLDRPWCWSTTNAVVLCYHMHWQILRRQGKHAEADASIRAAYLTSYCHDGDPPQYAVSAEICDIRLQYSAHWHTTKRAQGPPPPLAVDECLVAFRKLRQAGENPRLINMGSILQLQIKSHVEGGRFKDAAAAAKEVEELFREETDPWDREALSRACLDCASALLKLDRAVQALKLAILARKFWQENSDPAREELRETSSRDAASTMFDCIDYLNRKRGGDSLPLDAVKLRAYTDSEEHFPTRGVTRPALMLVNFAAELKSLHCKVESDAILWAAVAMSPSLAKKHATKLNLVPGAGPDALKTGTTPSAPFATRARKQRRAGVPTRLGILLARAVLAGVLVLASRRRNP